MPPGSKGFSTRTPMFALFQQDLFLRDAREDLRRPLLATYQGITKKMCTSKPPRPKPVQDSDKGNGHRGRRPPHLSGPKKTMETNLHPSLSLTHWRPRRETQVGIMENFRSGVRLHSLDGSSEERGERSTSNQKPRKYLSQCIKPQQAAYGICFSEALIRVENGRTSRDPPVTETQTRKFDHPSHGAKGYLHLRIPPP